MPQRRWNEQKRACQSLLWSVGIFAIVQFGISWALEDRLPKARDPEFEAKIFELKARIREAPDRPLVLALGSSRTMMGLQAGRLHASLNGRPIVAFNFGVSGGAALLEWMCLNRLLAAGVRPDLLVLEVLPPSLNQPGAHAIEEDWLIATRMRASEIGLVKRYHTAPRRMVRQWCKGRSLPLCWHREGLRNLLEVDQRADGVQVGCQGRLMDKYGWYAYYENGVTPEQRCWLTAFAHHQYAAAMGEFRLAPGPAHALHDVLARCRQEDIPVAILLMPEGEAFSRQYSPSMRSGLDAWIKDLCREWNAPLIDARHWIEDQDFWDSHHLLPEGAAVFTDRFQREALEPLLRNLSSQRWALKK